MKTKRIDRNHTGHRIGEHHHRAVLNDAEVCKMRECNDNGVGYRRLAKIFGCGISTARDIITYRTRWSA